MPTDNYQDPNFPLFWCTEQTPTPTFVDYKSRIRCSGITIKPCVGGGLQGDCSDTEVNNGLILCDELDSWNCNLCGNDLPYFNPIMFGDPLMFQFQQWDVINGQSPALNPITGLWGQGAGWDTMVVGEIYDCCTDTKIANVLDVSIYDFVGVYRTKEYNGLDKWTNIQQISLDVQGIYNIGIGLDPFWDGCFYFKFFFKNSVGVVINEFTSEPFKIVDCKPEDTIFLEGVYSKKDCFGMFYGDPVANPNDWLGIGTPFQYRNTYRVYGSFELTSFSVSKNFVGTRSLTSTSETVQNWLLRTNHIPPRVARLITNILSATTVFINYLDYIADGDVTKNNDVGNHWFIEANLKRITCSNTSSCEAT